MNYEPDTVWGRTVDGDREIAQPSNGLSLTQRRLLQRLEHPRSFATFAAQHPLDPPKLEHELIALAQLHLVAFQRPGATRPRTAPSINLSLPPGHAQQTTSIAILLPLCFAAAALGIASVLLIMT
jgi:hypothetical protein